jgi:osmotically-inducible protein OsmY
MEIQWINRLLSVILPASLAIVAWSGGIAQNAASAQEILLTAAALPAEQQHISTADQQLQRNVENALRSDPYFYDAHVTVSVRESVVVLQGFVFSDWDLRDAIRIATKAAAGRRVIDNLTIEVGGRK